MKRKEIIFKVDLKGNIKSEIKGTEGRTCVDIAEVLKNGMGTPLKQVKTSEFYKESVLTSTTINTVK